MDFCIASTFTASPARLTGDEQKARRNHAGPRRGRGIGYWWRVSIPPRNPWMI